jgi:hypothetical protein
MNPAENPSAPRARGRYRGPAMAGRAATPHLIAMPWQKRLTTCLPQLARRAVELPPDENPPFNEKSGVSEALS